MFRIAAGEELGYDDPEVRGHSIEFRINAEDGGRNFMPAPGTLTHWHPPSGPGIRLDGGYDQGETVPGSFDSLIAKLIVTGRDRTQALERSRRALDEFVVDGMPTVIPFHRPWSPTRRTSADGETFDDLHDLDRDRLRQPDQPYAGETAEAADDEAGERQKVVVEVGGKRLEVVLPAGLGGSRRPAPPAARGSRSGPRARRPAPPPAATP